jgi:hypothetical protein
VSISGSSLEMVIDDNGATFVSSTFHVIVDVDGSLQLVAFHYAINH